MKSIDEQIVKAKYRSFKKHHLKRAYQDLEDQISLQKETLKRLAQTVDKEEGDVERLEHISLNRLFTTLSGRENLRLEKERADAFRAALDYKLKQNDIEFLTYQKNLLQQELKQYEHLDEEYQGLLELKRKSLEPSTLTCIREMETTLQHWQTQAKELKEAMDQGAKLRSSFTYILDNLSELVEDTTEAKSLWYPVISQAEIEDVTKEIAQLNILWQNFEKELKDTDVTMPQHFDKDFLLQVSDYFYDMNDKKKTMKKINTSFEQLNATYSGVREVLCTLAKRAQEIEFCIFDLTMEIQEQIEVN